MNAYGLGCYHSVRCDYCSRLVTGRIVYEWQAEEAEYRIRHVCARCDLVVSVENSAKAKY